MHEQKAWLIDPGASSHMIGESMLEHVRVLEETGVCAQCSLASGEPMTLTRKVKVEVSFVAADLSIIRAQLSALVCANASHAILSTGCLARKGWSVVISEGGVDVILGNLSLGTTWYVNVGWVHSVSYQNTSLTAHHVSEVLDEGRAILGRGEPHVVAVEGESGDSSTAPAAKGEGGADLATRNFGSKRGAAGEDGADFATRKFFLSDKASAAHSGADGERHGGPENQGLGIAWTTAAHASSS